MKLNVKVLGGSVCEVEVGENETIERVKEVLSQKLKAEKSSQVLLFGGRALQDKNFVKDYKLSEGAKINLVIKNSIPKSNDKDFYSALRKHFKTEDEAHRVAKAFENVFLNKLSYLSLDDIERICDSWKDNRKTTF